jgi:hypothetical protein
MSTSKRHFTAVIGKKEHGLYCSSNPSSAAKKIVSKLCASDKKKKVSFFVRETTQGSKKKVYGPYIGEMKKLEKPIELKDRLIKYESVAHLDKADGKKMVKAKAPIMKKIKKMSGGAPHLLVIAYLKRNDQNIRLKLDSFSRESPFISFCEDYLFREEVNMQYNDKIKEIHVGIDLDDIRKKLLEQYDDSLRKNVIFIYLQVESNFNVKLFDREFDRECKWIIFPEIPEIPKIPITYIKNNLFPYNKNVTESGVHN